MLKRLVREVAFYLGFYNVYLNVVQLLSTWEFTLIVDTDLLPFFILLAGFNINISSNKKKDELVENSDR